MQIKRRDTNNAMLHTRLDEFYSKLTQRLKSFSSQLLVSFALAFSSPTSADFLGRVVSIADGDTLTVLVERQQVKVRLVEIDAPEKAQAFGNKSKQALADMVFGKDVQVEEHGKDKYKRTLGRVVVNGIDANAEMVRQGYAWVYRKYSKNLDLLRLEAEAREAKRGLWFDAEPVPPWEWRHSNRSEQRSF